MLGISILLKMINSSEDLSKNKEKSSLQRRMKKVELQFKFNFKKFFVNLILDPISPLFLIFIYNCVSIFNWKVVSSVMTLYSNYSHNSQIGYHYLFNDKSHGSLNKFSNLSVYIYDLPRRFNFDLLINHQRLTNHDDEEGQYTIELKFYSNFATYSNLVPRMEDADLIYILEINSD